MEDTLIYKYPIKTKTVAIGGLLISVAILIHAYNANEL